MKFLVLLFVFAFSTTGFAKELYTYKCTSIANDDLESEILRGTTSVTITELANVTEKVSWGERYDVVYKVKVDILQTLGSEVTKQQSFINYATNSDVEYNISAVKKEGVSIYIFLDEMDQAGIVFTDSNGKKNTVRLSCK